MSGISLPVVAAERRVLSDDVYDSLLELLFEQRLAAGERVSIDGLSRELGVSQTPIREALARLEADGLVLEEPLRGYTVTPPLGAQEFESLYETRLILEPRAARLAAERADSRTLVEIERIGAELAEAATGGRYREYTRFAAADAAFHDVVYRASGNTYLHEAIVRLRSHFHLSRLYHQNGVVDANETLPEHHNLILALRRRDPDAAEHGMGYHIARSRARLRALLDPGATQER